MTSRLDYNRNESITVCNDGPGGGIACRMYVVRLKL